MSNPVTRTPVRWIAPLFVVSLLLTACADTSESVPEQPDASEVTAVPNPDNGSDDPQGAEAQGSTESLAITDFIMEAGEFGSDSIAYGVLHNRTGSDMTIVGVGGPIAIRMEIQPEGSFVVPADGSFTLEPSGTHITLGSLGSNYEAGERDEYIIFILDDGTRYEFAATIR